MRLRNAVTVLAATAALVATTGAPAGAGVIRTYTNVATGLCIDSNARGQAYVSRCNGGNFQKWDVTGTDSSTVLRNVATGLCLDSNARRAVYTLGCNGGNFQKWTVTRFGDGSVVRFRNVATGLCLDNNTEFQAYTLSCNAGNFQKWRR
ncbi:RICIN domain-containing protein [Kineococcus gynurae]|uniref:RICIN domain-containing protein n=1 Tax=Kineococcus gynurae TaxID=452979 RepID=A0ABV5LXK2_9ACTN